MSRGAAGSGGRGRAEAASSSGSSAYQTAGAISASTRTCGTVLSDSVAAGPDAAVAAMRGRGGSSARGNAVAGRGRAEERGSAQRVSERTYSVGADDVPS
jgi:hypothetical protein